MAKKNQLDMILVLKTKNMNEQKCYSWMFSTNEVSSSKLYCYIVTTETLVRAVCDSRVISESEIKCVKQIRVQCSAIVLDIRCCDKF